MSPSEASLTELEFSVSDPGYPFVDASRVASCRCVLRELLPRSDDECLEFFELRDAADEEVEAVADLPAGTERLVDERADRGVVVFRTAESRCLATTLADRGAALRTLWAEDGEGRLVAEVMPSRDATDVVEAFQREHPSLDLVAKRDRPAEGGLFADRRVGNVVADQLTDRQREVLVVAYRNGYFQRPRETTGAEVAARLDISSSTFAQHMRAAQRKVLATVLEETVVLPDDWTDVA